MNGGTFRIGFNGTFLAGDTLGAGSPQLFFIHGAGSSGDRKRFEKLRALLADRGISSAAFDLIGHGETGGSLIGSSLESRVAQVSAVINSLEIPQPISIVASSMGGYIAIKLTELYPVKNLVVIAPAVYDTKSYSIPFGPAFTKVIRKPFSWRETDAWEILEKYTGNLLIYAAEKDQVIPHEVITRIHDSARNARFREVVTMEGATHSLAKWIDEHPDALRDILERISELSKPGSA